MKTSTGKIKAYAIIRDKNGIPRFDDIYNIPEPIWNGLSEEEKKDIENRRKNNASNT